MSCSAATPSTEEPLSLAAFDKLPKSARRAAGRLSDRIPEGTRGKSLLHRGSMSLEERYYGNARSFDDARLQQVLRDYRPSGPTPMSPPHLRAESVEWDPVAHAAPRPVHVVAR